MLRRTLVFLFVAGCATEPAVEPVTPAPPTVMVEDEPKAPEPEGKPAPEPTAPVSTEDRELGGLGLRGSDSGETGTGEGGIGLGNIGTIGIGGTGQGFGIGSGRLGRQQGAMNVKGSLDKEIIRRVIRSELGAIRACYEKALEKQPTLEGRLAVRFVIAPAGHVSEAKAETSLEPTVDACVVAVFQRVTFPKPEGGSVVVRYPLIFKAAETK